MLHPQEPIAAACILRWSRDALLRAHQEQRTRSQNKNNGIRSFHISSTSGRNLAYFLVGRPVEVAVIW
jgi:hypothetical protein